MIDAENKIVPIAQDIWWSEADLICIPTNSTLDRKGHLVMGAGLALSAKQRYPELPKKAGDIILPLCLSQKFPEYGLIRIKVSHHLTIALLQTKTDWRSPSSEQLILNSLSKLAFTIEEGDFKKIALSLPGAGYGGLKKETSLSLVNQVLSHLSEKVILCDL
jgi:hypothetical protein